jgi:quinol monooxygenase YgiN
MSQKILVTNFTFSVSPQEFKAMVVQLAQAFADVPGCVWKIWLIAEDKKEAGAVYLFADDAALQTFKASPLVASVLAHPALGSFELRERAIIAEASAITRAPL